MSCQHRGADSVVSMAAWRRDADFTPRHVPTRIFFSCRSRLRMACPTRRARMRSSRVMRGETRLRSHKKNITKRPKNGWQRAPRALCSARDSHRLSRDLKSYTRDGRAGQAARSASAQRHVRLQDRRAAM